MPIWPPNTVESNRRIFKSGNSVTNTITMATGDTTLLSKVFKELSNSTDDRTLLLYCADDDSSTPTIKIEVSLLIGDSWTAWTQIEAASVVPKEVKISAYGKAWWFKNIGVTFRFTKAGAGAVTFTRGEWI